MRKSKLNTSYSKLPIDQTSTKAHKVFKAMTGNEYYPAGSTTVDKLILELDAYDKHVADHSFMTPPLTKERDQLRQAVVARLGVVATECNGLTPGNTAALLSTGLDLAAEPKAKQTPALIVDFVLLDGTQAGSIIARLKRPADTVLFLARYTTDPDLAEKNWEVCFGSTLELLFAGLPSGAQLRVKVAALNGTSTPATALWTQVLLRRVQ